MYLKQDTVMNKHVRVKLVLPHDALLEAGAHMDTQTEWGSDKPMNVVVVVVVVVPMVGEMTTMMNDVASTCDMQDTQTTNVATEPSLNYDEEETDMVRAPIDRVLAATWMGAVQKTR